MKKTHHLQIDERTKAWFWQRVIKDGVSDCWPWMGELVPGSMPPHVFAYNLTFGREHDKLQILQGCGNPRCCNPSLYATGKGQA